MIQLLILKKSMKKKKQNKIEYKDYYFAAGRLTKQKDFYFLCEAIKEKIKTNREIKLLIAGEGEEKKFLQNYIITNNLEENIVLLGYVKNIFPYFINAKAFILSSLWEDPGFVLIEAAYCRTLVLSNDSEPGPREIIKDKFNGIVFKKKDVKSFNEKFDLISNYTNKNFLKYNNLKNVKKFTLFNHYLNFKKILNNV